MFIEVAASLKIPRIISTCLTCYGNTLTRDEICELLNIPKKTALNVMKKLYKDRHNLNAFDIQLTMLASWHSPTDYSQTQITIKLKR